MSAEPFVDVVHVEPKSVQRLIDEPLPRAPRRPRKPKPPPPEVSTRAAHSDVWARARELGVTGREVKIGDDGSVLLLNTKRR